MWKWNTVCQAAEPQLFSRWIPAGPRRSEIVAAVREHVWPLIAKEGLGGYYHELFVGHPDRVAETWERFAAALMGLIEQLDGRLTISAHGIPMAVPHTRPITLTAHATDASLVTGYRSWIDRVEVRSRSG